MTEVAWGLNNLDTVVTTHFSTHLCAATILRVAKFQQQWLFTWACIGKKRPS